jgi:hypothetical protein
MKSELLFQLQIITVLKLFKLFYISIMQNVELNILF